MNDLVKRRSLTDCVLKVIDNRGKTPKKLGTDWSETGYRAISANNVKFDGLTKLDSINYLDEKTYHKWMKDEVMKGDLLLTSEAPAGQVMLWMSDEKIVLSQRLFALRTKDDVDNKYLKYYLQSNVGQNEVNKNTSGSTVFGISSKMFDLIQVSLPNYSTQVSIGNLLYLLDSKIELNNRINANLEAMSKTLYDYWFVQFDYPNSEEKPYKSSRGKMVWCEKLNREIPEGWEVKPLEKIIEKIIDNRGKTPLKLGGDWSESREGVIALSAKHVKSGKLLKLDEANVVTFEMFEKWMPNKLQEGDILMTSEAPCGEFYLILSDTNYCLSQRLFAIRADKSKVLSTYLYFELSKGNGYSQILGKQSGSTVFGIRQDELRTVNILKPDIEVQKLFDEKVLPMLNQIRNNEFQNQQLSSLRDWLLPMLMNGQVKVGDASSTLSTSVEWSGLMVAEAGEEYGK